MRDEPFAPLPEPDAVIVVYDAKTGAVRHVHQEITMPGGTPSAPDECVKKALRFAQEMSGQRTAGLKAVALGPRDRSALLQVRGPVKVDLKRRTLVPVGPARRAKAAVRRGR